MLKIEIGNKSIEKGEEWDCGVEDDEGDDQNERVSITWDKTSHPTAVLNTNSGTAHTIALPNNTNPSTSKKSRYRNLPTYGENLGSLYNYKPTPP